MSLPVDYQGLVLQEPSELSRDSIQWKHRARTSSKRSDALLACISAARVEEFYRSECARVHISYLCKEKRKLATGDKRLGMLLHNYYRCPFGKDRKRQTTAVTADAVPVPSASQDAVQKRVGKRARGLGIKQCECTYSMKIVVYALYPGQAYVQLNNCGHHSKAGASTPCHGPGSEGPAAFLTTPRLSDDARKWAKRRLRDGLSSAEIMESTSISNALLTTVHDLVKRTVPYLLTVV